MATSRTPRIGEAPASVMPRTREGALRDGGRDVRDLPGDDLLLALVARRDIGLRHLRADLPEPDSVLGEAEDGVAAALEGPVLHGLHGQEDGLVDALRRARQDVGPEIGLVGVDADPPDVLLLGGVERPEAAPARDLELDRGPPP